MNNQGLAWGGLLLLAILLIVGSIQGSHGRMFGVIFAPKYLEYGGVSADEIESPERSQILQAQSQLNTAADAIAKSFI